MWAPHAARVGVIGDWNGWTPQWLEAGAGGVWTGTLRGPRHGQRYKLRVVTNDGRELDKADPYATFGECPPATASVLWTPRHDWKHDRVPLDPAAPMATYEVHLGSWRKGLGYRDVARPLIEHVRATGFTHVELLPVMEHPFYGSWGYQVTGYFAPTARYGTPDELMGLIDALHGAGIGVVLDWVPAHFPRDEHALFRFDGTHLYEHPDPRRGHHPDWDTAIFDYGRPEVREFLLASALWWLQAYRADGLRVDAVASMLYLDYSRAPGQWEPNWHGGNENLEAIAFLKELTAAVRDAGGFTIAEESTAWPGVTSRDGLGFDAKWDLGWMHDTLEVMRLDPVHRKHHHDRLTFRSLYAFSERFVLPLSHDEVVYGKGSLIGKMPGDPWQRRANLRLLLALQWLQPGKKTLFMGGEWGHEPEWSHDAGLDWSRQDPGLLALVARLNRLYRELPALHAWDWDPRGFEWIAGDDADNGVLVFVRHGPDALAVCVVHVTPEVRYGYRIGLPGPGTWEVALNTDDARWGGSGAVDDAVLAEAVPFHGREHSAEVRLPPLGAMILVPE